MALVAFDHFAWADLFDARLTTIAQPTQQTGKRAVAMLLARLADPEDPCGRFA
jgi:LacI family transcriptional regulator